MVSTDIVVVGVSLVFDDDLDVVEGQPVVLNHLMRKKLYVFSTAWV